ncbi:GTA-gp10 family protein [Hyphococcus sp. DH-69]|uniref:GTA-gp10 family protein n=1 Tax=Hyphococcus formosus TaxID=3143534 RepID=UPI00398B3D01
MTHPRGDVRLQINGEERVLRLTLGALADIEDKLGGGDLAALQERLKNPRISDIVLILHALIAGGGTPLAMEALKASDLDLSEASKAIAKAFSALEAAPGKSQAGP